MWEDDWRTTPRQLSSPREKAAVPKPDLDRNQLHERRSVSGPEDERAQKSWYLGRVTGPKWFFFFFFKGQVADIKETRNLKHQRKSVVNKGAES